MIKIDLKVTFSCNNNCKFCVQGKKRYLRRPKTLNEIMQILKKCKNISDSIVLSGGDPTIRKDLFKIISFAKSIGYKYIQLQTNGRLFSYMDYCRKVIEAGANDFFISIHGDCSKTHDYLTSSRGSFLQTSRGIENLKNLSQRVSTNTVITKQNFKTLPKISRLLIKYDVEQMQFAYPHIIHNAALNYKTIIAEKNDVIDYVHEAIEIAVKNKKKVMTEAIPYCFMKGFEKFVAERIIPETKIYDADIVIDKYSTYRKSTGKIKSTACRLCSFFTDCEGPWKEYPQIFGWNEFIPLKNIV